MVGPEKLIDDLQGLEAIAPSEKDCGVSGEGKGVAGDSHKSLNFRFRHLSCLLFATRPWRIENQSIIAIQFPGEERALEEVPSEAVEPLVGSAIERADGGAFYLVGVHLSVAKKSSRETPATGEEISKVSFLGESGIYAFGNRVFSGLGGL